MNLAYLRYLAAQVRQAWSKRNKDSTFRTSPFVDSIIASTALPFESKILCVGSRNRMEPDCWRQRGYPFVIGIDLLPSPGLRFADMHRLPFSDGYFDLAYYSHVLEHAFDPTQALAEAGRVLKVGGYLFAAFPIGFTPSSHDRINYGDKSGFVNYLPTGYRWRSMWARTTSTECALLLRMEGKGEKVNDFRLKAGASAPTEIL